MLLLVSIRSSYWYVVTVEVCMRFMVFFGVCKCDVFVCFDVCVGVFLVVKCNFVGVLYAS